MLHPLILIIDDELINLRAMSHFLTQPPRNFEVRTALNGEQGFRVAKEIQPTLIITDWEMPVMNGLELLAALKASPATRDIPVLMATGRMISSENLEVALQAGAIDYMRKPVDFVELTARVNTAIRIYEAQRQIQAQHQHIRSLLESEKEQLREQVAFKARQLSASAMLTAQKNAALEEYIKNIDSLYEQPEPQLRKGLKQLKRNMKQSMDIDQNWDAFKMHFEEVHPAFFTQLTALHPKLTLKEQQLAAYLRMGIGNKELAQLLQIAHGSVKTALHRLKKKFTLAEERNLRTYLSDL